MGTLDKLWGTIQEEADDMKMVDTEEQVPEDLIQDRARTEPSQKLPKSIATTTPHEATDTIPLFPTAVRFKIIATSESDASKQHLNVLESIKEGMNHCEIYSKKLEKINYNDMTANDFEYHKQGNTFVVVHRMVLDEKYHHIKKNKDIFDCIKRNNCYLQEHVWSTQEWDTINVGFLSGVSPQHQSKESIVHKLNLIEKTNLRYNLHTTMISTSLNGTKLNIYAYEIQCLRSDADLVSKYIAHTSREYGQTFIKYKWKYSNPQVFVNAIVKQKEFIDNIRTIPIYGITGSAMVQMKSNLMKRKEILEVRSTSKTMESGRWNAYTKLANFQSTTKWLQLNLPKLYDNLDKQVREETPSTFNLGVRFNTTIVFETEDDPLLQYAIHSVDTLSDNSSNNTWNSDITSNKTWASVASNSKDTSSITTTSELSKTVQKLSDSILTICLRLDNLEKILHKQNDLEKIIHKHNDAIAQSQTFQKECNANMQKLADFIERLEDRTNRIKPRKLDDYYETSESNKRQNTNLSPQKNTHS